MAQITIYVDEEIEKRLRDAAAQAGQSVSAWVAGLIRKETDDKWPPKFLALAGSWKDDDDIELVRSDVPDLPREPL